MESNDTHNCENCGRPLSSAGEVCGYCGSKPTKSDGKNAKPPDEKAATGNLLGAALLTFPLWGTPLIIGLGCMAGRLVFFLGFVIGLASGLPIVLAKSYSVTTKLILVPMYYAIGLIVAFILGWMSLCWFCHSCH